MTSPDGTLTVNARPAPFALDPSCTAVIVVDMQNDFASEGGAFARSGRDISSIRSIIGPMSEVLTAARDAGMKVIYLKIEFRPDLSDVGPPDSKNWHAMHAVGIGESVTAPDGRPSQVFIRNTWNTDIVSELTPQLSDIVVSKRRYSGFYETDLDSILRGLGIKDLVFMGCTTSVCVESTLRDAMYRDYRCLLLADCTAEPIGQGLARSNHEATLLLTQIPFGWVSDSVAVLEALAARSVAAATTDPLAIVEALDTACNAGDLEAVMALFAADAVVRQLPPPPDGGVYRGTEQVRAWFAPQLAGFRVDSHDREAHGDTVSWSAKMIADPLRQMGVREPVEVSAEAVVRDGKIVSFTIRNPTAGAAAQEHAVSARA
jgi:ureidoacrylate peracid hydrolase